MIFNKFERMTAGRYLRAKRKEGFISVITGFAFTGIALGVATLIIVMSVMNGFRDELLGRILGMNGHIGIVAPNGYPFNNYKDAINIEELENKLTDYFDEFDYIVGDIAYGKLRLKGFNSKQNKNFKEINDVDKVEDYIKNNCAYGCRWFMISEIKD